MNNINMKALSEKASKAMSERITMDLLVREVGQLTARLTALEEAVVLMAQHDSEPSPPPPMNQAQRAWLNIHYPLWAKAYETDPLTETLPPETPAEEEAARFIKYEISFQRRHSEKTYPRQRKWLKAAGLEVPTTAALASELIMKILEKRHGQEILRSA